MDVSKKKPSRAQKLAAPNPLTGEEANSYTATKDRELPAPKAVHQFAAKTNTSQPAESRRLKAAHKEAVAPGGSARPALGYDKPEGMSDHDFGWTMGVHKMFTPRTSGPAINAPHLGTDGVTVQRRAEDLTAGEYKKAGDVVSHYGHDGRDPLGSVTDTLHHQMRRVITEHVRAGVDESASQLFYGGPVNTDFGEDYDADEHHTAGVRAAADTFARYSQDIASHPRFKAQLEGLSRQTKQQAAKVVLAQAAADTSPQSKWRENDKWPNLDQAKESVTAGLEDRMPTFTTGRKGNEIKAANRAAEMVGGRQFDAHNYGDQNISPKTSAFRGALIDRDAADSFSVTDIHHAGIVFPGLPTGKSHQYTNGEGNRVNVYPDEPASAAKGLSPRVKVHPSGEIRQQTGYSRAEQALSVGKPHVHALIDRGMRQVGADLGINRSVDHTDNVHAMQAALWGSQQARRPDVNVSHADQYPVVRDWAAEGHDTLTPDGRALFGHRTGMGPQFRENPNRTAISKDGSNAHDVSRHAYDISPRR